MSFPTSRRYLLTVVVAVLAAFVVLVQRDTFVRRWLVPTPVGQAKLEQVLPQVEITDATLPQAAAELSRLAGVSIDVEPHVDRSPDFDPTKYSLRLKNVTLGRALELLADQGPMLGGGHPCAVGQGDRIRIIGQAAADAALVFRVYDVSDLLPPPGVTSTKVTGSLYQGPISSANPTPATDRELAIDGLVGLMEGLLPEIAASPTPASGRQASTLFANATGPCVMMNDKLIVVAPEWAQARVAEVLAGVRRSGGGLFRPLP
jgi:hypothetical protein